MLQGAGIQAVVTGVAHPHPGERTVDGVFAGHVRICRAGRRIPMAGGAAERCQRRAGLVAHRAGGR